MNTVTTILARLNDPTTQVDRLLEEYRQPLLELWKQHPELYRKFTLKLIQQGHPGRALELAREGVEHLQNDTRLQYSLALAAARGGNPLYAQSILKPLLVLAEKPDGPVNLFVSGVLGTVVAGSIFDQPILGMRSSKRIAK